MTIVKMARELAQRDLFARAARWSLMVAALVGWAQIARAQVVEYYHLDALGSIRAITNQAGVVIERHDYLPFGEEWAPQPTTEAHKFTGKERDAETGLDYFGARYYSGPVGRFSGVDPVVTVAENLVDPQRWNRYAYVRNNPLRYTDPDGRVIDTILDVGFIGYDLFDIGRSVVNGGGISWTQGAALGADVLSAVVPFASGGGAAVRAVGKASEVAEAGKLGLNVVANRALGKAAESKVAAEVVEEGTMIVGAQVCCRTPKGRRVVDLIVQGGAGELTAIEVKSGNATRKAAQRAKDVEIAAGRGTFVGKNAGELNGKSIAMETIERRPKP